MRSCYQCIVVVLEACPCPCPQAALKSLITTALYIVSLCSVHGLRSDMPLINEYWTGLDWDSLTADSILRISNKKLIRR